MKGLPTLAAVFLVVASATVQGAAGVLFFNRIPTATAPITLSRVNADGSGDQAVNINLPSAMNPIVSRDGRLLLVTSPDPGRPFKQSGNVYVVNLLTGAFGRATSYEDEVVQNGVRFNPELGRLFGNTTISSYMVNFPNYKAFSPNGSQVVVMNLHKSGVVTLGSALNPRDVEAASGRLPIVDVYNLSDALPAGPFVFLSAQARDGFNQGGDGVDWHPGRDEVVAAVASDIPVVGNSGRTSMEGTVLAVFSTASISPFIRKLTNPVGEINAFIDLTSILSTATGAHDYAPAISPDGARVAYVRHTLRQDSRFDGAGIAPLPSICTIRVVNYDGTGDREVITLAAGLWITKLAWAPDASEIAFDLAPQAVLNGFNSLGGDFTRSEIHLVGANGANPRRLVAAPASFPTWSPLGFTGGPAPVPTIQVRPQGRDLAIDVGNLVPGRVFEIEGATVLGNWVREFSQTATASQQSLAITPSPVTPVAFYRVRIP